MIPKIIHYCWFGGKDLPQSAKKYIESWEKFLPSYEIKRWDESNFDVNAIKYTREAYAAKNMLLLVILLAFGSCSTMVDYISTQMLRLLKLYMIL